MRKVPSKITILVDSREQKPLYFPAHLKWYPDRGATPTLIKVVKKVQKMDAGDYCLEGYDDVAIVERKGSIDEIAQNMLSSDHTRSSAAFQRLVEACEFPYLLVDCPIQALWKSERVEEPARAIQCLFELAVTKKLGVIVAGSCKTADARRKLGETVLTLLLSHALADEVGPIDILDIVEKADD